MTTLLTMESLNLHGKVVLIREDFNVPIKDQAIADDARIRAAIPSIQLALKKGAKQIIIMSHLGRAVEGVEDPRLSLRPVAERLEKLLGQPVSFVPGFLTKTKNELALLGNIVLLDNVRFNVGEEKNDPALSKKMAALCDVFVMDAFATAHRAQASTCGVTAFATRACAGPLLVRELAAITKVMKNPKKPVLAIVGGSKVSTKLKLLESIISFSDQVIVGGGIANTFIAAQGHRVGKSLYEPEFVREAQRLMSVAKDKIIIPTDVIVATEFSATSPASMCSVSEVQEGQMILDVGIESRATIAENIAAAGTILWNGPVGVFEMEPFSHGTESMAQAIAKSSGYSVAGGGDTLSAIAKYHIHDGVDYISTGGGAFLEMLEGTTLPAVKALEERAHA